MLSIAEQVPKIFFAWAKNKIFELFIVQQEPTIWFSFGMLALFNPFQHWFILYWSYISITVLIIRQAIKNGPWKIHASNSPTASTWFLPIFSFLLSARFWKNPNLIITIFSSIGHWPADSGHGGHGDRGVGGGRQTEGHEATPCTPFRRQTVPLDNL